MVSVVMRQRHAAPTRKKGGEGRNWRTCAIPGPFIKVGSAALASQCPSATNQRRVETRRPACGSCSFALLVCCQHTPAQRRWFSTGHSASFSGAVVRDIEQEEAADGARCCDESGGDDDKTHSTRTRQRWRGAQPLYMHGAADFGTDARQGWRGAQPLAVASNT